MTDLTKLSLADASRGLKAKRFTATELTGAYLAAIDATLRTNYFRLYLHYGYFDVWANLYGQITQLTPLIMMGPGMMAGAVTFGTFQQVSNAYGRVDGSFSIILDNWTTLTELRSIWKRLHEFERNLDQYDTGHDVGDVVEQSPLPT